MSIRISAADWAPGGLSEQDLLTLARAFKEAGVDLIDVSTGQVVPQQEPVYGRMYQTPFADKIRNEVGIATMAVGNITGADQVNTIVVSGRAAPWRSRALISPIRISPYMRRRGTSMRPRSGPNLTLPGREQAYRLAVRDHEEWTAGREALKPPSHEAKDEPSKERRPGVAASDGGPGKKAAELRPRAPGRYPLYPINRRAAPAQKCAPPSRYPQESSRGARPPRIHTLSPEPAPRGSGSR